MFPKLIFKRFKEKKIFSQIYISTLLALLVSVIYFNFFFFLVWFYFSNLWLFILYTSFHLSLDYPKIRFGTKTQVQLSFGGEYPRWHQSGNGKMQLANNSRLVGKCWYCRYRQLNCNRNPRDAIKLSLVSMAILPKEKGSWGIYTLLDEGCYGCEDRSVERSQCFKFCFCIAMIALSRLQS